MLCAERLILRARFVALVVLSVASIAAGDVTVDGNRNSVIQGDHNVIINEGTDANESAPEESVGIGIVGRMTSLTGRWHYCYAALGHWTGPVQFSGEATRDWDRFRWVEPAVIEIEPRSYLDAKITFTESTPSTRASRAAVARFDRETPGVTRILVGEEDRAFSLTLGRRGPDLVVLYTAPDYDEENMKFVFEFYSRSGDCLPLIGLNAPTAWDAIQSRDDPE